MPSAPINPLARRSPRGLIMVLLASLLVTNATLWADDFTQPEPLEPDVAPASGEAEEVMAGIRIPQGWTIDLFAAEPDVANIVAFDIDHRGRVYVCESFRQNRGVTDNRGHDDQWLLSDLSAQTVQDRIDYHKRLLGEAAVTYAQHDDRIRRLDDVDGDGKADRSYLLANGFNRIEEGTGAGILARGSDVYFTNIPKLWKLIDQDDDGAAEERVVLSDGYGVRVAFRGHDLHGLTLGPDRRLYFSIGDRGYHVTTADGRVLANPESGAVFRCELDGSDLEVFATGLRNPQELAFNDLGDLFSVDNNSDSGDRGRIVHILQGGDSGWRMHYQYLPDRGPFNREKIWEPFHPEQPAYIVPPVENFTDGPSGLVYYPGTGFGDQLRDTFLICDFRGGPANSGVRSFQLASDGAFYRLSHDHDPIWTVLATDIAFGPDGAIYLSDWVDGWEGLGKGRIYRLQDPEHADSDIVRQVELLLRSDWSTRPAEQLIGDLSHPDRRIRFEAQWQLAERGDVDSLIQVLTDDSAQSRSRMHALWGLDLAVRLSDDDPAPLLASARTLLNSSEDALRAAAAQFAGQRGDTTAIAPLRTLLADDSARVRYFAALALAQLDDNDSFPAVVKLLADNDNADPALRHAGVMYLASLDAADQVGSLAAHGNVAVRRAAVVALRRSRSEKIISFLSDADPLVVLEAARAIHDVPIPVALSSLAEMVDMPAADPELLRRVLNANYRIGGSEAAARVASLAANVAADQEMRLEALDMLQDWPASDPRDRVLGCYRPLETRSAQAAAEALAPELDLLMSHEEAIREKAIQVAAELGLKQIVPRLIKRIGDAEQRPALRATALRALVRLDRAQAAKLAEQVEMVPANQLLSAALDVLAQVDAKGSINKFIEATSSRDMQVRQLGWDILGRLDDPAATMAIGRGVGDYLQGTLPTDVQLNVLEAADGRLSAQQTEELAEYQRGLAATDALAPWLVSLQGGDAGRGAQIFFEKTDVSCLRCHQVDRAGGQVGPNLTVIGKQRDRRYLLESICLPDAQIAKGFETAVIADDFGQVYTGIIKGETDEFVELIQNDGRQIRIPVAEIVARRSGKSSMPSDLVKLLTPRQLRDLVAYLASLQVDPRGGEDTE